MPHRLKAKLMDAYHPNVLGTLTFFSLQNLQFQSSLKCVYVQDSLKEKVNTQSKTLMK